MGCLSSHVTFALFSNIKIQTLSVVHMYSLYWVVLEVAKELNAKT